MRKVLSGWVVMLAMTSVAVADESSGSLVARAPAALYTWSLDADMFTAYGSIGGSRIGPSKASYANVAAGVRVAASYLIAPAQGIGGQLYVQLTHDGLEPQMSLDSAPPILLNVPIDVLDVGVAAFKHWCWQDGRTCITPLVGASLAMMNPELGFGFGSTLRPTPFGYVGLGGRAEARASWAVGAGTSNQLSVGIGADIYSGAFIASGSGATSAQMVGLDHGGALFYGTFGYVHRFGT